MMTAEWRHGILRGSAARGAAPVVVKIGGSILARPEWPAAALRQRCRIGCAWRAAVSSRVVASEP